jgi:hypothetical protein
VDALIRVAVDNVLNEVPRKIVRVVEFVILQTRRELRPNGKKLVSARKIVTLLSPVMNNQSKKVRICIRKG